MKSRNKEVNIFNMSLLDILCGALGAFCFMMLSLFPDHAKVKDLQAQVNDLQKNSSSSNVQQRLEEAERQRDQAKAEQTLAYFRLSWEPSADLDVWIMAANGHFWAPKKDQVPPDKLISATTDVTKGPGSEITWFSDVAYPGAVYRMFVKLQALNGAPLPIPAHGYIVARVRINGEHSAMGLSDLGVVQLTKVGDFVEVGRIEFKSDDFDVYSGALTTAPANAPHFLGRDELPRLLDTPRLDLGGSSRH